MVKMGAPNSRAPPSPSSITTPLLAALPAPRARLCPAWGVGWQLCGIMHSKHDAPVQSCMRWQGVGAVLQERGSVGTPTDNFLWVENVLLLIWKWFQRLCDVHISFCSSVLCYTCGRILDEKENQVKGDRAMTQPLNLQIVCKTESADTSRRPATCLLASQAWDSSCRTDIDECYGFRFRPGGGHRLLCPRAASWCTTPGRKAQPGEALSCHGKETRRGGGKG